MKKTSKKLVVANWKMSPQTHAEAEKLAKGVLSGLKNLKKRANVVLCPPFPWLTDFSHKIKSAGWGAQDVFWEKSGAYTGEVSAKMLKSSGVSFVIVGHSERREHLTETDEMVNKKVRASLEAGLKTILCVGEKTRENSDFQNFVRDELSKDLKGVSSRKAKNLIIAYEPIWAIGTGETPEADDILEMGTFIRRVLFDILGKKAAYETPVIYGGSVDAKNSARFFHVKGIGGLLVGGASLNPKEFLEIVKTANE